VPELEESDHVALVERGPLSQATADALDVGDQRVATNEILVVMGDGFRRGELGRFAPETDRVVEAVLRTTPFDELRAAINVYRVDVASTDSGTTDPVDCAEGGGA
jgi:hypothetical protein